jgi:hypothetical protein
MKYTSKYKLLLRIVCSPIVLLLLLVTFFMNTMRIFFSYLWYGGEWITYTKNDPNTIHNIYQHLKND